MNRHLAVRILLCVVLTCLSGSMASCKSAPKGPLAPLVITDGMKVTMNMTVTLPDRIVVSSGKEPITYIHGKHEIWPSLEIALAGMKPGEKKTITLLSSEAAGPYDENKKRTVKLDQLPLGTKVGTKIRSNQTGVVAQVVKITGDSAEIDENDQLAGKDVVVSVTILKVEKP